MAPGSAAQRGCKFAWVCLREGTLLNADQSVVPGKIQAGLGKSRCVLELKLRERGRTHVLTHAQAPSMGRVKGDPRNVRAQGPASGGQ